MSEGADDEDGMSFMDVSGFPREQQHPTLLGGLGLAPPPNVVSSTKPSAPTTRLSEAPDDEMSFMDVSGFPSPKSPGPNGPIPSKRLSEAPGDEDGEDMSFMDVSGFPSE
jgi:hypothetical protein